jgi:CRISPR-associated protein Cmr6
MGSQKSQKNKSGKIDLKNLATALGNTPEPLDSKGTGSNIEWDLSTTGNIPLQVLKLDDHVQGNNFYQRMPENQQIRSLLEATASADKNWQSLYAGLCSRVEGLAAVLEQEPTGKNIKRAIVIAEFPGYSRVGGLPGFRERLLPVMHPVYGIPYVPASSIKGVIKAWARNTKQPGIDRLLGYLDGKKAAIAAVEILDAFPMQPCLKVDVATPQWNWDGEQVKYKPVPHQLLSLENLKLQIGLRQTSCGTVDDVKIVKTWLEDALLSEGMGSRVSAGYGRASKVNSKTVPSTKNTHRFISHHKFEFWSQGMYGVTPPTRDNHYEGQTEFRTTAVRGILRYWFRAVALGLFPPAHCQTLEHILFGTLEPKARHGHIQILVSHLSDSPGDKKTLHQVSGTIALEAKTQDELTLLQHLLCLATHVGGVGRGSRRPLHINKDGNREDLRGCYWQLTDNSMKLAYSVTEWLEFLKNLRNQCAVVKQSIFQKLEVKEQDRLGQFTSLSTGTPGTPGNRYQDVLNSNARIYLLKASNLKHPSKSGWNSIANRGAALEFLYSSGYKGKSKTGQHNVNVGGALETPSFAWITSNHLQDSATGYQVITVFGANQSDRAQFCEKLTANTSLSLVEVNL